MNRRKTAEMLRELRALSRELVALGSGDLAAMVEDIRLEVARGRR
jgi:hypothetical protein